MKWNQHCWFWLCRFQCWRTDCPVTSICESIPFRRRRPPPLPVPCAFIVFVVVVADAMSLPTSFWSRLPKAIVTWISSGNVVAFWLVGIEWDLSLVHEGPRGVDVFLSWSGGGVKDHLKEERMGIDFELPFGLLMVVVVPIKLTALVISLVHWIREGEEWDTEVGHLG